MKREKQTVRSILFVHLQSFRSCVQFNEAVWKILGCFSNPWSAVVLKVREQIFLRLGTYFMVRNRNEWIL